MMTFTIIINANITDEILLGNVNRATSKTVSSEEIAESENLTRCKNVLNLNDNYSKLTHKTAGDVIAQEQLANIIFFLISYDPHKPFRSNILILILTSRLETV